MDKRYRAALIFGILTAGTATAVTRVALAESVSVEDEDLAQLALQTLMTLDVTIVTAQRRPESLQDTPISIIAFNRNQLDKFDIAGVNDLGSSVPNLQVSPHPNSGTTPRIFM